MSAAFLGVVCLLATTATAQKPPYDILPCNTKDQKQLDACVLKNVQNAMPKLVHGDPKLGIPDQDPLIIKEIAIKQGTDQVGLRLILSDCKMYGNVNNKIISARTDLKKRHMEWKLQNDGGYQIIGNYKASGKVLLLPITGAGKFNFTITGVKINFDVNYGLKKKKGKDFIDIKDIDLTTNIGKTYVRLDNLFNGDKLLGNNMNRFLNENSQELTKELSPEFTKTLSILYKRILTALFTTSPYDTLFSEK